MTNRKDRANPRRVEITVPNGQVFNWQGECYEAGEIFTVPHWAAACFAEDKPKTGGAQCFPGFCTIGSIGAYPIDAYRDVVFLPAGVEVIVPVPKIECCEKPAFVEFTQCSGGCLFVDYDQTVAVPEQVLGGIAPDMNPSVRYIGGDGNACPPIPCVENIHLINTVDSFIQLTYYSCS